MLVKQRDEPVLISVAMPIYNAGEYLLGAVDSIIAQTYPNWELIIIDDGSTDNAINSIELIKDKRIRILKDGLNKGLAARLNEAIGLARGKYFARMDQDDISMPERFMLQVNALESDSSIDLVATRVFTINNINQIVGELPFVLTHQEICGKPWLGFYMPHPTWMGRLSWFKRYQYRVPQTYYSEDYELLLRSYQNSKFACLSEVHFKYRVKETIKWGNQLKARQAVLKLQTLYFLKQHQYSYIALSFLMFLLRISLDCYKLSRQTIKNIWT